MGQPESLVELDVGTAAHGGSCVARLDGRIVFVRHALPGERVRAVITEDRGDFLRADAVEVLVASADRVPPPCPFAGPGKCGGCDWQHVRPSRQRELKADVVREQFRRLAHLDVSDVFTGVTELPGGPLGWRTRITYAVDAAGRPGLHRYRSADLVPVDRCLLGAHGVGDSPVLAEQWPGLLGIEVARDDRGRLSTLAHRPGPGRHARGRRPPDRVTVIDGPDVQTHIADGHPFEVAAAGFWQVHPEAVTAFASDLVALLAPQPGERVLELYSGAGALTASLARAVTPGGTVLALEADARAVADATTNLAGYAGVTVRRMRITPETVLDVLAEGPVDLVAVDPPRAGLGRQTTAALLGSGARAIGYVACDPAALARDVAVALASGWRLSALAGYDAFPMTHHVECIAVMTAPSS